MLTFEIPAGLCCDFSTDDGQPLRRTDGHCALRAGAVSMTMTMEAKDADDTHQG